MQISQIQTNSLLDFPGCISSVVFLSGCNYGCESCHAKQIRDGNLGIDAERKFLDYLGRENWVDGVVILGGEPTIHQDLPEFLRKIKDLGKKVKLDTNGSNPGMLQRLLEGRLVDYVAMDIKGPKTLYPIFTGNGKDFSQLVEESMKLMSDSRTPYELRTTVVPIYRGKVEWMNREDMNDMARWIGEVNGKNVKYFLQKFVARGKDEMIGERFSKDVLPKEYHETPKAVLEDLRQAASSYLNNVRVR